MVLIATSCGVVEGTVIQDPTDASTPSDSSVSDAERDAMAPGDWAPTDGLSWQIQLSGQLDISFEVDVYDVDLFEASLAQISALNGRGVRVICYLSAGTFEPFRDDADDFPASVRGNPLVDYPNERWLDIRSAQVREIMRARLDRARDKGCDAIQLSSVNAFEEDSGFDISAADQLEYNRFLADETHARSMAAGLTNDYDQISGLLDWVDFGVLLECFAESRCQAAQAYTSAGKAAFHMELLPRRDEVCELSSGLSMATVFKESDLGPARDGC